MEERSDRVPFFSLSVFLLPGEDIPLRIFEPRYKQLIKDVRDTGTTFVIPFVIGEKIQEYGCEVMLKEVLAVNPLGRMVITVEGISVVEILGYERRLPGKLYAGGPVRRFPDPGEVQGQELLDMIRNYTDQFDSEFLKCCTKSIITYHDVVKALNLPSGEKYRFISMSDPFQKEKYLAGQLRYLEMIRHQETLLGDDFAMN
jgi:Lon protease-like protein